MPVNQNEAATSWEPLYTIERSGLPEVTVSGLIAVDRGNGAEPLVFGDETTLLWSRSLLKPLQFISLLPVLEARYPELKEPHFAVMMASQNGDPDQITLLDEIREMGHLTPWQLQCPETYPMSGARSHELRRRGESADALYHPCAGKHLATLLAIKARDGEVDSYLNRLQPEYERLRTLVRYLAGDFPVDETVDGCGMPNIALSAAQMARLYSMMARPLPAELVENAPRELKDSLALWPQIVNLFKGYPHLIGGMGRLDTRIIEGRFMPKNRHLDIIAKEGADGLLAVGVGPFDDYPDGLGIFIKVASGYEPKQLETVLVHVLEQLGLERLHLVTPDPVLKTRYHFDLRQPAKS